MSGHVMLGLRPMLMIGSLVTNMTEEDSTSCGSSEILELWVELDWAEDCVDSGADGGADDWIEAAMVLDELETGESGNGIVMLVNGGIGDMVELAEFAEVDDLLGGVCLDVDAGEGETLVGEGVGDLLE